MGASSSRQPVEVQVHECAAHNDVATLQLLLNRLRAEGTFCPTHHLEWTDSQGRTPLLVAAARGHVRAVQTLLEWGANTLHVNRTPEHSGTALHEATRACDEDVADLLLSFGANPFQCDVYGRTCLDEAVMTRSVHLLHKYEVACPWAGVVSIKAWEPDDAGRTMPFRLRYAAIVPHLPVPVPDTMPKPGLASRQLWIYMDKDSVETRRRVKLDDATLLRMEPTDVLLRLCSRSKCSADNQRPDTGTGALTCDDDIIHLRPADSTEEAMAAFELLVTHIVRSKPICRSPSQTHASPQRHIRLSSLKPSISPRSSRIVITPTGGFTSAPVITASDAALPAHFPITIGAVPDCYQAARQRSGTLPQLTLEDKEMWRSLSAPLPSIQGRRETYDAIKST